MSIEETQEKQASGSRAKFIIGGVLIIAAVVYLIVSSTKANAQYFMTIEEVNNRGEEILGRDIRVSGAVIGDTIVYDSANLQLEFVVAHIPGDNKELEAQGGLVAVLAQAVKDPNLPRMKVVYNGVMPDLLRNEAQAIMTGQIDADGVFHAEELLLKCPTKYEEALPEQSSEG